MRRPAHDRLESCHIEHAHHAVCAASDQHVAVVVKLRMIYLTSLAIEVKDMSLFPIGEVPQR